MAIGRVSGSMLVSNLDRQGTDLQFTTGNQPLFYLNFSQFRAGINTNVATQTLTINGNLSTSNIVISGNSITTKNGESIVINGNVQYSIGNLQIAGGNAGYIVSTDGAGHLSWQNLATLSNTQGFYGNTFIMGTAAAGSTSNALVFTATTSVTDGIASLNRLLGNITDSTGSLIHVPGTVTATGFAGSLSGSVTGNIAGTTASFSTISGTLTTASQPNITALGSLSGLTVVGNVTAGNVSATQFNGDVFGSVVGATGAFTNVAGTLQTAAQPNITSVGTLASLDVTGNVTAGNVSATQFNGNIVGTTGTLSGNLSTNNVSGYTGHFTNVTGTLQTAAQPNVTSVGTLTGLTVTGNITATEINGKLHGNVTGQTGMFSSNVTTQGYMAFGLNSELLQSGVAAFVNDSYGFTTQYNTAVVVNNMQGATNQTLFLGDTGIGNARTLLGVSVNSTPVLTLTGTGDMTITGNLYAPVIGNVTGTVTGNIVGTTASFTTVGGTLTTAAQPNITSVGTLSGLTSTGNIVTSANVTASSINATQYGNVFTNNISGTAGNLTITIPSNQVAIISSDQAVKLPSGSSATRPTGVAGYIRYNSDTTNVEYYDGSSWVTVTNKVSSQTFSGDGVNATYTLSQTSTVQNLLVSVNGTLQQPNTSYTVSGTQITFTEVLLTSDVVDIRYLGGVTSFSGIVTNDMQIQGNLTITGILQAPQATKSSNAPGSTGQVCWDTDYIYVCTAPNTWKRSALAGGY